MKVGSIAPSTTGFVSTFITPPTKTEGNVTTITDFIKGVSIASFEAEEDKLVLVFADKDGKTIKKFINNPEKDPFLESRKPDPETWVNNSYKAIQRVALNFITTAKYTELFSNPDEELSFQDYVSRLFLETLNKFDEDVLLKVVFQEKEGLYSKYKVGENYWIGKNTERFEAVKWNEGEYKSSDIIHFTKVEKQPDALGGGLPTTPVFEAASPMVFDPAALDALNKM